MKRRLIWLLVLVPVLIAGFDFGTALVAKNVKSAIFDEIDSRKTLLFDNLGTTEQDYRIPAVFTNAAGEVVAVADRRFSALGADIGAGRIHIESRVSADLGKSWGPVGRIINAGSETEDGFDSAHGDAAVVCDRETGRVLLLCASGDKSFPEGGCALGRYYSDDGGRTFAGGEMPEPEELKGRRHFFSSGRICQSSRIKVGSHYRIYSGVVTSEGAWIFFSDDFGQSWKALGKPVKGGNESKVEELPDGSLLHSCRILNRSGRMFCTYKYTDDTYTSVSQSEARCPAGVVAASCNGELLLAPSAPGEWLLLQSVARSDRRENVSIYYKRIRESDPFTDPEFYDEWDGFLQVSDTTSCYSSMTLCPDGSVGFVWEENNTWRKHVESYDIFFRRIELCEFADLTLRDAAK